MIEKVQGKQCQYTMKKWDVSVILPCREDENSKRKINKMGLVVKKELQVSDADDKLKENNQRLSLVIQEEAPCTSL